MLCHTLKINKAVRFSLRTEARLLTGKQHDCPGEDNAVKQRSHDHNPSERLPLVGQVAKGDIDL